MSQTPDNKETWLRLLKQTSIPSFSSSINALASAKNYESSHSSELARIILKDPNLTASVLKLANSVHFNAHGQSVRTISRALMVLGHKSIKEVCASCMLMEQFLKGNASSNLQALLARSFHSAIQAKEIARLQGQKSTEEIFIAALLLSLGEISVYSAVEPGGELAVQLHNQYPIEGGKERDLIGCYFSDLTLGLCQAWNIAPMIGLMLGGKYAEDSPVRSVLLGSSFASACEIKGFDLALDSHLKSIVRYTKKSPELVVDKVNAATEDTQKSLTQFGLKLDVKKPLDKLESDNSGDFTVKMDKELQLDIIQELSLVAQEKIDINFILPQLLEGIVRGAGFQCALVALLTPDRSRLQVKHAVAQDDNQTKENFNFSCQYDIPEVHQKVMVNQTILVQDSLRPQGATLQHILKRTGCKSAIWGPLIVENKVIGCFYANNGISGPQVTQEQKEAFQLFVFQAKFFLQKLK